MKPVPYQSFDKVRIITPRVFVRCGYPMSFDDARAEILATDNGRIMSLIKSFGSVNVHERIVDSLAYGLLKARGFGGRDRTIHTLERPELMGRVCRVFDKRVVKTGVYRRGYDDPEGGEPPSLRNVKTHVILHVDWQGGDFDYDTFEIEAANVERYEEPPIPA